MMANGSICDEHFDRPFRLNLRRILLQVKQTITNYSASSVLLILAIHVVLAIFSIDFWNNKFHRLINADYDGSNPFKLKNFIHGVGQDFR